MGLFGWSREDLPPLSGKVALVTGANSGARRRCKSCQLLEGGRKRQAGSEAEGGGQSKQAGCRRAPRKHAVTSGRAN